MPMFLIIGFLLGVLSALFFALYMVPQKVVNIDTTTYLWAVGAGVFIAACIAYALAGFPHTATLREQGLAVTCGLIWGLGTLAFAASIKRIGLALATPIKNTTGILGTLVGLVGFGEWRTTNPWLCLSGSLLIVASAIAIGLTGDRRLSRRASGVGIMLALVAALCYASYLYPFRLVLAAMGYWQFSLWMSVGILTTTTLAVLVRPGRLALFRSYPLRSYLLSALGGVSWISALYCLAASMELVDLSVAWSLAQLNTLPAVLIGIVVFREVHFPSHWRSITAGLAMAVLGTVLLGFSK